MTCPHCSRPLWRDFAANLYHPHAGAQRTRCRACAAQATYQLPAFLCDGPYLYFGALVIGLSMLAALSADLPTLARINACASVFVAWLGLIALLTWTKTETRVR